MKLIFLSKKVGEVFRILQQCVRTSINQTDKTNYNFQGLFFFLIGNFFVGVMCRP